MRLGSKSNDVFICTLNDTYDKIKDEYSNIMKSLTVSKKTNVMLGDSSVKEESTFEPGGVASFYRNICSNLDGWSARDVMITNNEDCRRVFVKFDIRIGSFIVSGHLSTQFHVLLYYRPEYRVVECQKELSDMMEKTKNVEADMAKIGEKIIIEKLGETIKDDDNLQELFEKFYNDDTMREDVEKMIEKHGDGGTNDMIAQKQKLFKELDGYLYETYRISDVLIDDARLVTGEEGFLCTFDLERVNADNSRDGLFDLTQISKDEKDEIVHALEKFSTILHTFVH